MKDEVLRLFAERGVTVNDIAVIVHHLQNPHMPDLTMEECVESIHRVLEKREVQHAVLTGIALDILAEKDLLPEPLLSIVKRDEPLYGVDEILALAVTNVYGSVGLTSFGYLDKRKLGVIKRLNSHEQGRAHLLGRHGGRGGRAAARIAHQRKVQAEDRPMLEDNSDLYRGVSRRRRRGGVPVKPGPSRREVGPAAPAAAARRRPPGRQVDRRKPAGYNWHENLRPARTLVGGLLRCTTMPSAATLSSLRRSKTGSRSSG